MHPDELIGQKAVRCAKRMAHLLEAGVVRQEELYFDWLVTTIASGEDLWNDCLDAVPEHLHYGLLEYGRSYLSSVDFMPPPGVVCPSNNTPEVIEAAMQKLRPRYIKLLEFLEETIQPKK